MCLTEQEGFKLAFKNADTIVQHYEIPNFPRLFLQQHYSKM